MIDTDATEPDGALSAVPDQDDSDPELAAQVVDIVHGYASAVPAAVAAVVEGSAQAGEWSEAIESLVLAMNAHGVVVTYAASEALAEIAVRLGIDVPRVSVPK